MVSKRNFFTMLILLLILIFMFMFSGVLKQELNEYGTNSRAEQGVERGELKERYDVLNDKLAKEARALSYQRIEKADYEEDDFDKRVIFLGRDNGSDVAKVVGSWCRYMKRPMITYYTLQGLTEIDTADVPEVIIVDGEAVNWEKETQSLLTLTERGACVIFARTPLPKELKKNDALREMMGIKEVYSEDIAIDGIRLFPEFFVGNEEEYMDGPGKENRQDLDLTLPWYVTGEGTKIYMMGLVQDRTWKNESLPSIVWRHAYGEGKVFCIVGDYLTKESGIGFLTACMGEKDSYDIYPVINAQNLVLANYGGFSDENSEILENLYDRRQVPFFRDVVWSSTIAMTERSKDKISLLVSPQMDYTDDIEPTQNMLIYYLRLLNEGYGEAGVSTKQTSSISLSEKLAKDKVYWQSEASDYVLQSAYLEQADQYEEVARLLPDVKTVVVDKTEGEPISYLDGNLTCQVATSDAMTYTFMDDICQKSYETALGYSNIVMDMSLVSHPKSGDYSGFSRTSSGNVITYWKQFSGFAKTTLSESDVRIRRFFALDYMDGRKGNEITLHVDGFDEQAFFILKLNRDEIKEVTGAQITNLKNGFYLLDVSSPDVVIKVKERTLFYR
ncbi:MAG: DUF2194 domain-containing protein [Acetatifactor sp.]|nr:DUF2194 domain-containing protein [Acetatifactor sp.]